MPLYEYECESCGKRFERIQKFSDPPETVCPSCGGAVRKLVSSPAIQFKGSGWYVTDYARKGQSGEAPASGDGKPGEEKPAKPEKDAPAASARGGDGKDQAPAGSKKPATPAAGSDSSKT